MTCDPWSGFKDVVWWVAVIVGGFIVYAGFLRGGDRRE